LSAVVEGWLLIQVMQIVEKSVEVFAYLFLLILNLFVLGFSFSSGKLGSFFVLQQSNQLPPSFVLNLILIVPHFPQSLP